jgi:predicted glutamine amidotransferase
MCQLLGMNAAEPTDCTFSLRGFVRRGGGTDVHAHGFGIVFYDAKTPEEESSSGDDVMYKFHDTEPACQSSVASRLVTTPVKTHNMISHIRYATSGAVCAKNVHPFTRELWAVTFTFAHNGDCPPFSLQARRKRCRQDGPESRGDDDDNSHRNGYGLPVLGRCTSEMDPVYFPVGDTDSEAVFCSILNALHAEFAEKPPLSVLRDFLQQICEEIVNYDNHAHASIFNFLLGCGKHTQFAYSWPGQRPGSKVWNGLHYIVREPPFSTATLIDVADYTIDFATVTDPKRDRVAIIATKPLTQEADWIEFKPNQLILFRHGRPQLGPASAGLVHREATRFHSAASSASSIGSASTRDGTNTTQSTLSLEDGESHASIQHPPAVIQVKPFAS